MMQSPALSDSGRAESPVSSNPGSPFNNNNNSNTPNQETKYQKQDSPNNKNLRYDPSDESLQKDIKAKFSVLSTINKENSSNPTTINRNNLDQILYPKPGADRDSIEPSAKFSIERLKQLADQRLSPSNIENSSLTNNKIFSIDHSAKYQNNSSQLVVTTAGLMPLNTDAHSLLQSQINHHPAFTNHHQHHLNILSHNNHLNNLKYAMLPSVVAAANGSNNNGPSELDIERIKLARTLSNGKELSDFGFRIQLGGLTSNYTQSDTHSDSEELNVDGNEDSSQDGHSVS